MDAGIEDERIHEMDWWENRVLSRPGSNGPIRTTFICCPAQHSSGACSIVCLSLAGTHASATPLPIMCESRSWNPGSTDDVVGQLDCTRW